MIGVFDSGLGGLSVVREVVRLDPTAHILYLGDRAWAPYGERSLDELRIRCESITRHLLDHGADTVAIACNTASAAALTHLRRVHPDVLFVGMEPAVKPAAQLTRSGVVGVLATPATFQGELFASVVDRFADGIEVLPTPCPGWVRLIEEPSDDPAATVAETLAPLLERGADVLVLACTHFPFLRSQIAAAAPGVHIVDPGEAVARQILRTAAPDARSGVRVQVTGPGTGLESRIGDLTGLAVSVESVTFEHRVT